MQTMSISEMRDRRDVLIEARNRALNVPNGKHLVFHPAVKWLTREIRRYQGDILIVALKDGQRRAAAERDGLRFDADGIMADRWREDGTNGTPGTSTLGRMSDEQYRRAMEEEYMRKQDREDARDEPSKPAQSVADAMREEAREAEYDKRGPGATW